MILILLLGQDSLWAGGGGELIRSVLVGLVEGLRAWSWKGHFAIATGIPQ